ncbi:MAG: hypothetical protein C4B55_02075 [Candidatus Methanophagaceae archaeon]|nr:MAG: hypothetical protein C4B55_02075 [Methanophagales archaeon]
MSAKEPVPVRLDKRDKELLQLLQDNFPVEKRPWAVVGERLGLGEDEVLSSVQRLSAAGVIRKLRTILDAKKVGACSSTLLAMRVPAERLDEVVGVVNEYLCVTHNYRREHDYNLWFTVTTCGGKDLERTVEEIKRRTGVPDADTLDLPTTRVFKIDVRFRFTDAVTDAEQREKKAEEEQREKKAEEERKEKVKPVVKGSEKNEKKKKIDQTILRSTQDGVPLVKEPFAEVAEEAEVSQEEVVARLKKLVSTGVVKRLGVSVNQRRVGIVANAVVAWKVPAERVESVGTLLSGFTEITHCYERATVPGKWEHNLFTVIHGYDRASVEATAKRLSDAVGISEYLVLFSGEQFKRTSVMHPY